MTVIPGSHLHGQIPFENSTKAEKNVLGQDRPRSTAVGRRPRTLRHEGGPDLHAHRPAVARVRSERIRPPPVRPDDPVPAAGRPGSFPGIPPRRDLPGQRSPRATGDPSPGLLATIFLRETASIYRQYLHCIYSAGIHLSGAPILCWYLRIVDLMMVSLPTAALQYLHGRHPFSAASSGLLNSMRCRCWIRRALRQVG